MIKVFIKKNSLLFYFLLLSLLVIFLYLVSSEKSELFHGAEQWFNLLFQFAIGYVVNFMFFVTQVYIPSRRRELIMTQKISYRLSTILNILRSVLTELSNIYLDSHTGNCFTDEELTTIANKISLNNKVNVIIANVENDRFTVRQWLLKCIKDTETEIDKLYKYFSADITEETIQILEEISLWFPLAPEDTQCTIMSAVGDISQYAAHATMEAALQASPVMYIRTSCFSAALLSNV